MYSISINLSIYISIYLSSGAQKKGLLAHLGNLYPSFLQHLQQFNNQNNSEQQASSFLRFGKLRKKIFLDLLHSLGNMYPAITAGITKKLGSVKKNICLG